MFSWYKYLIVSLVFSHLGFWSGSLFLIAPFPDLCLLVLFSNGVFFSWTCFPDVLNIHVPQYFSVSDSQFVLGGLATLQRGDVHQQQLCEQIKQLKVSGSGPKVKKLFSCSTQFILLINVKMPTTIVGI